MKKSFTKECGNWFKSMPWYGIVFGLALTLGFQTLMYTIGYSWIPHDKPGMWYGVDPQITAIDGGIPLCPYVFAQLYIAWKVIFPVGAILSCTRITYSKNKEKWINLMISWFIAILIGGLVLIFYPTYVDRYNVAGVPGGNIFEYMKDKTSWSWDLMKNNVINKDVVREFGCLPSFHCLQIIFCYLSVACRKEKHIGLRIWWLVIAILICLSTLFTKQHYIIDVLAAMLLALLCFVLTNKFNPGAAILKRWPNFLIIKKINWSHEKIHNVKNTKIVTKSKDEK